MPSITYELSVRKGPEEGQVFPLSAATIILGRDPMSDIVLTDPEVSRQHARLLGTESGYTIQDLGSTNGTFVDGRRLKGEPVSLAPGDVITMGSNVTLLYEYASGEELVLSEGAEVVPAPEAGALSRPAAVTERLAESGDAEEPPVGEEPAELDRERQPTGPTIRAEEDTGPMSPDVTPGGAREELPSFPRAERARREPPPAPPYRPTPQIGLPPGGQGEEPRPDRRTRNIIIALIVLLLLCCCCFLLTGYYVWGDPLLDLIQFYLG